MSVQGSFPPKSSCCSVEDRAWASSNKHPKLHWIGSWRVFWGSQTLPLYYKTCRVFLNLSLLLSPLVIIVKLVGEPNCFQSLSSWFFPDSHRSDSFFLTFTLLCICTHHTGKTDFRWARGFKYFFFYCYGAIHHNYMNESGFDSLTHLHIM